MKKTELIPSPWSRREFLNFLGKGSLAGLALTGSLPLSSCQSSRKTNVVGLLPSLNDNVELIQGLQYRVLIEAETSIGKNQSFGYNNDYVAFLSQSENEALLWVNHESITPYLLTGRDPLATASRTALQIERKAVGGSLLKLRKISGEWQVDLKSPENFRVDATTPIPFANNKKVLGQSKATGSFANCSGGMTPWGTFLSCEENYDDFIGEAVYDEKGQRKIDSSLVVHHWPKAGFQPPPEHYGWVVEVNPKSKTAKKHTALGRFAHEAACVVPLKDGRVVVYMGDDGNDQCIYKFISNKSHSLDEGELFVANFAKGQWISLEYSKNPLLQKHFKDPMSSLIRTREAAKLVGGTEMNRPEDIERDPNTGAIIVALTGNLPKNDYYGSLLKIEEENNNPEAMSFSSSTLMTGGKKSGFCCPDNLVFAPNGDLWFTVDISEKLINTDAYKGFGNNSLFHVPRTGPNAGEAIRVANAPIDSEFCGPYFSDDGKTLFLAVQHPGKTSSKIKGYTSHWPHGGSSKPKPAVIAITGKYLS